MPWAPHPGPPVDPALQQVGRVLDPVLVPLGFAAGQAGGDGARGQVIFCRGDLDGFDDGCVDLVVDLAAQPAWHVVDVRYWGFPVERWHLRFDREGELAEQLAALARTLPHDLA